MDRLAAGPFWDAVARFCADAPAVARAVAEIRADAPAEGRAPRDPQLADFSLEWAPGRGVLPLARFSHFGTSPEFFGRAARALGFPDAPDALAREMAACRGRLKDGSVQCGFSFRDGRPEAIKAYFDVKGGVPAVLPGGLRPALSPAGEAVTLLSFTFGPAGLAERKAYYPCGADAGPALRAALADNPAFRPFAAARPYDALVRLSPDGASVTSIKTYYYLDENPELDAPVSRLFSGAARPDFRDVAIRPEVGIDFALAGGINKIDYYFGCHKRKTP